MLSAQAPARTRLEGAIEHSERLGRLDSSLKPGNLFDQNVYERVQPTYQWYRIPDWAAGLWYTLSESGNFKDLRTGRYHRSITRPRSDKHLFGMQQDRQGGIWHCVILPRQHVVQSDPITEYRIETERTFAATKPGELVTRYCFTAVQVYNASGVIADTRQQESIMHISPLDRDRLKVRGSLRTFDFNGLPTSEGETNLIFFKSRPFKNLDAYRNADMLESFRQYLLSRNQAELLPSR